MASFLPTLAGRSASVRLKKPVDQCVQRVFFFLLKKATSMQNIIAPVAGRKASRPPAGMICIVVKI